MEQLIVLGTGHAGVTRCYNTCCVLDDGKDPLLVDAGGGNGILTRLEACGVPLASLHHAFLSHSHTDHLFGMLWVLRMIASSIRSGHYAGSFSLYGHAELLETVRAIAAMTLPESLTACFGTGIELIPVTDGETRLIGSRKLTFFDIGSTKLQQFGFSAQLADGQRVTFLGDEPLNPCAFRYADHVDWLLSEAFCLDSEKDRFKPHEKHHGTVKEACAIAEMLHVRNLVLWHTEDTRLAERKHLYTAEGQTVFTGNLVVPDDGERLKISF